MNSEFPENPRAQLEAKLTALLFGELPPEEAAALRETIARDPQLSKVFERLQQTIYLVQQTEKSPVAEPVLAREALRLSDERRQALLQKFKTVAPKEFAAPRANSKRFDFSWLIPAAVAAALMMIAGVWFLPSFTARTSYKAQRWTFGDTAAVSSSPPAMNVPAAENERKVTIAGERNLRLPLGGRSDAQDAGRSVEAPNTLSAPHKTAQSMVVLPPAANDVQLQIADGTTPNTKFYFEPEGRKSDEVKDSLLAETGQAEKPKQLKEPGQNSLDFSNGQVPEASKQSQAENSGSIADSKKQAEAMRGRIDDLSDRLLQPGGGGNATVEINKGAGLGTAPQDEEGFFSPKPRTDGEQKPNPQADRTHTWALDGAADQSVPAAQSVNSAPTSGGGGGRGGFGGGAMVAQNSGITTVPRVLSADDIGKQLSGETPPTIDPSTGLPLPVATPQPAEPSVRVPAQVAQIVEGITAGGKSGEELLKRRGDIARQAPPKPVAESDGDGALALGDKPMLGRSFEGHVGISMDPETRRLTVIADEKTHANISQVVSNVGTSSEKDLSALALPNTSLAWGLPADTSKPTLGLDLPALSNGRVVADHEGKEIGKKPEEKVAGKPEVHDLRRKLTESGGELALGATVHTDELAANPTTDRSVQAASGSSNVYDLNVVGYYNLPIDAAAKRAIAIQLDTITNSISSREVQIASYDKYKSPLSSIVLPSLADNEKKAVPGGPIPDEGMDTSRLGRGENKTKEQEQPSNQELALLNAKKNLESLQHFSSVLDMKIATEGVEKDLPKTSMVELVDTAKPATKPMGVRGLFGGALGGEYRSTARIKIEPDSSDVSFSKPQTTSLYDPHFTQMEFETIRSDKVLGEVVRDLKLNEAWGNKETDAIALLRQKLELRPVRETSLVEIGVKSDKADEAAKIANAIASTYQRRRVEVAQQLSRAGIEALEKQYAEQKQKIARAEAEVARLEKHNKVKEPDVALPKASPNSPIPQPEIQTCDNAFSTFSLNISDVSFKLAAASLEKGTLPEAAGIRSEEFINAFDYRDPEAPPGVPVAFAWDRAQYPFAQNRDLLRFSLKTAAQGRQQGRPLNLVLLLDNSGSMERADRVRIIHEALHVLAKQLQPQDKLSIITFSRTPRLVADGVPGNQATQAAEQVDGLTPQGGTNLEEAMNLAYQTALRHYEANGMNRVVLLTDGAANLGNVEPEALKKKVEDHRKQRVALDCFGIGWEGYNDDLLEVLSRNGDGRYGFINTPEEASTEFASKLAGALHVAASDVKVQVEFNPKRVTAYRQVGYAKHQLTKQQFRDNTVDAAEIAAAEAGNALYVVEVNPAGEGPLATVRIRYKDPGTTEFHEHEWPVPYTGNAMALEQAGPAMRLAASAGGFSEWLAGNQYAAEVSPDRLLGLMSGVPEVYGADARPKKLEWMIRQAKSLAGK